MKSNSRDQRTEQILHREITASNWERRTDCALANYIQPRKEIRQKKIMWHARCGGFGKVRYSTTPALGGIVAVWNMILIKLSRMHTLWERERKQHRPEANDKLSRVKMRAAVARRRNLFNDLRLLKVMRWENTNNKAEVKNGNNYHKGKFSPEVIALGFGTSGMRSNQACRTFDGTVTVTLCGECEPVTITQTTNRWSINFHSLT